MTLIITLVSFTITCFKPPVADLLSCLGPPQNGKNLATGVGSSPRHIKPSKFNGSNLVDFVQDQNLARLYATKIVC